MVIDKMRIIITIDNRDVIKEDSIGLIIESLSILIHLVIYRPEGHGLVVTPV